MSKKTFRGFGGVQGALGGWFFAKNTHFWPFWGVKIARIKKILFDKLLLLKSFGRQCGLIFLIRTLGSWFFAKNGYFRPVFQKRLNRFDLKAWVGGFWTWYHQHTYRGCQKTRFGGPKGGSGGARRLIFRQKYPFFTIFRVKIARIKNFLFDKLLLLKSFGRQCGLIFFIQTLGSWFFAKIGYFRPIFQKRLNRVFFVRFSKLKIPKRSFVFFCTDSRVKNWSLEKKSEKKNKIWKIIYLSFLPNFFFKYFF